MYTLYFRYSGYLCKESLLPKSCIVQTLILGAIFDMDPSSTTSEVGDSTTSIPKALNDEHQRQISVDSGIDMILVDGDNLKRSDSTTETDLMQDGVATDRNTKVYRKNSETACSQSGSSSQALDSADFTDFTRSISQESNDRVIRGNSSLPEKSSTMCMCIEDGDPHAEGEDYPDCSESAASHAVRRFYDTLLDMILVSVDELESKLYSIVAKCPGMAGTVPEFKPMSRQCPG